MILATMKQASAFAVNLLLGTSIHHGFSTASAIPPAQFPPSYQSFQPKTSTGYQGGVASESAECTKVGKDLLALGGNAVDALVGTTFCVGVVGMYHSGIGGGGFMIVRDQHGEYEAVDFRESAPAAGHENMYWGNVNGSKFGGLAAGVPGEVAGLEYVHNKYGSLPWKTCMEGAIDVAKNGFVVSKDLVKYIEITPWDQPNLLLEDPVWAEEFAPNGTLIEAGQLMTRPRYASSLEKIAAGGAEAFYKGEIAESLIKTIQDTNGTMTLEDLANYQVITREVHKASFRNNTLHTIGAPANGPVTINILKAMENLEPEPELTDLAWHRYVEAMKWAYSYRLKLGDPEFVEGVYDLEREMMTDETAKAISEKVHDDKTMPVEYYNPKKIYTKDSEGTSHISTADETGMAVSLTTTVNLLFGAQIMDPLTGIIINNEMNDFSIPGVPNEFGFEPTPENFVRPGKRPLSSCTPIIASRPDGSLLVSVGAAGGSRIVSSTAQTLWHAIDHGMTLGEAINHARVHHQLMPDHVLTEYGFSNETVESLHERGHGIKYTPPNKSIVHGVWVNDDGTFEAVGDPRQGNSAGMTLRSKEILTVQD